MTPTIWIIQEGVNDYSPAEQFGTVKFVTTGDIRSIEGQQNDAVRHDIRAFKAEYIAGTDYILPTGNPMVIAMVMMSLPTALHKFLKWDRRQAKYIPHTLSGV